MERSAFAGSRIRERRVALGLRQAEVALRAGISGSYLNLIEHNRRRIGGKLSLGRWRRGPKNGSLPACATPPLRGQMWRLTSVRQRILLIALQIGRA
jgi:DNA-binding XRE family transcriptional regulator